jgi:hypothetical protein
MNSFAKILALLIKDLEKRRPLVQAKASVSNAYGIGESFTCS